MIGTFWSLVPSIVAIALALITKEVYTSLFVGIVLGALFFSLSMGTGIDGFIAQLLNNTVGEGEEAASYGLIHCLSDPWNVGILIFLVELGTLVTLVNKAGGARSFGHWAERHVKSRTGAQLATVCFGLLIFIDDYFNCLTVGSVMKPITDRFGVSREKLAYLIDSTAAPVCIIAPISSWAAAVSGFASKGENGIALFCSAIPFNFYALLTIVMLFAVVLTKFDFKEMARCEKSTEKDEEELAIQQQKIQKEGKRDGSVWDLIIPIIVLIVGCVLGMIYSGGYFDPKSANHFVFIEAFAASNASIGLVIGSLATLIGSLVWFVSRKVLTINDFMSCITEGFKAMVPAILILTLAWTLKSETDALGATTYVAGLMKGCAASMQMLLPAVIFLVAALLAFATGTSWGTFGILIPICVAIFEVGDPLRIISISACMAGAVCGDHVSPISDTTIMASAGARCKHVRHVTTQLPYAMTVASISAGAYVVAGLAHGLGLFVAGLCGWGFAAMAFLGLGVRQRCRKL